MYRDNNYNEGRVKQSEMPEVVAVLLTVVCVVSVVVPVVYVLYRCFVPRRTPGRVLAAPQATVQSHNAPYSQYPPPGPPSGVAGGISSGGVVAGSPWAGGAPGAQWAAAPPPQFAPVAYPPPYSHQAPPSFEKNPPYPPTPAPRN